MEMSYWYCALLLSKRTIIAYIGLLYVSYTYAYRHNIVTFIHDIQRRGTTG